MAASRADRCGVAGLVVAALLFVTTGCGGGADAASPRQVALADRFLDAYVAADGSVVRHDQGGDVVSEGEAYAMLLAEVAGRPATVRSVWRWSTAHLQRDDGLLSWHATADGRVLDTQSAADADVLAAYALLRYEGAGASRLAADGRRVAAAVLANETVRVGKRLALAAGPWAVGGKQPTLNPSYWMPTVFRSLARTTDDARWRRLARGSVALLGRLTRDGRQLPPDWAKVVDGRVEPTGAPGSGSESGSGEPRYGLDAARLPIWLAVECADAARTLSARWWPFLGHDEGALARSLDGHVTDATRVPLPIVAAAASADAAGDGSDRDAALAAAVRQARAYPTYYGDAWVALGAAVLDARLARCPSG